LVKIFINSVPKSGTHLLLQLVTGIPGIKTKSAVLNLEKLHIWIKNFKSEFANLEKLHVFNSLVPYEVVFGHVVYRESDHLFLQKSGIKQIFLYRDFRDNVVSAAYDVVNRNMGSSLYNFYENILNRRFEDLVTHIIEGIQHPSLNYEGIYKQFKPIFPWKDIPGILVLRYEDLVRSQECLYHSCKKILDYLYGNTLDENKKKYVIKLMMQNMNSKTSETFRKGSIGDLKTELNDRLKASLKNK
jgi:hypothetical protein